MARITRGELRFVKYRKNKKTGLAVSRCNRLRRFTVKDEVGQFAYKFRCREFVPHSKREICGWAFPYDTEISTTQRAPIEVRMHAQAHYPTQRWARKWGRILVKEGQCPQCGFDTVSWRPRRLGD